MADAQYQQTGFMRSLFGPSKKEIWGQLAQQLGGTFSKGGFFGRDKVIASAGQWTVTLDTYVVRRGKHSSVYTRMRAPYLNKDGFTFTIYRAGFFTGLGEMLGMHDIRIGDAAFDEAFVIKANDEERIRALLSDETIRALMAAQPRVWIEVKDDEGWFGTRFPDGVDELYFKTRGVIKDIDRLQGLFDLFSQILHQLCHIDSAYEDDPGITLK